MTGPASAVGHGKTGERVPLVRVHNRVTPVLFAAAAAAVLGGGFVSVAPNRLVSGQPVGLFAAADGRLSAAIAVLGLAVLATALLPAGRAICLMAAALAASVVLAALAAAGVAEATLAATAPNLTRVSLGAGFWVLSGVAALSLIDAVERAGIGRGGRIAIAAALAAAVAAMASAGLFDSLSLAREYEAREAAFAAALVRHIVLVVAAIGPALLIGFPLGVAAARRPHWRGPIFAVLNLLQTIPSIALFGLLILPLSALAAAMPFLAALGVAGIGPVPAVIALILYALLPVVRNTAAGIAGVDPAATDAARGMGMTPRQVFWRIELPLAAPLLIAGLRIVTVQTIGLAVVAALIGAGGLGTFVFAGLGQYAADLVLLGALPTIALALAADFLLQNAATAVLRR
jgi:osmoprotectant transport system permease protein